jgi:hypothetical protein
VLQQRNNRGVKSLPILRVVQTEAQQEKFDTITGVLGGKFGDLKLDYIPFFIIVVHDHHY